MADGAQSIESQAAVADYDVVVVGAGLGGIYALHRFRAQGLRVLGLEGAAGVGGVWFHSRYPGARVDVDSLDYCYYFSPEIFREWTWSERYATQPELLKYLNHVADRFDLRPDIQLETRVTAAHFDEAANRFMADKMVALEPIKAEFCHMLCRALRATRVVEVGTSFGVSTLYLADAVRANGGGVVIGTEYEPAKTAAARANFAEAGVADLIDLREGDLRETLKVIEGPVDFVLMDIWTEMARPAIELIAPHLRPGAVIIADNTERVRHAYGAFFAFVNDPANGLRTMTLPFDGGLEMVVKA